MKVLKLGLLISGVLSLFPFVILLPGVSSGSWLTDIVFVFVVVLGLIFNWFLLFKKWSRIKGPVRGFMFSTLGMLFDFCALVIILTIIFVIASFIGLLEFEVTKGWIGIVFISAVYINLWVFLDMVGVDDLVIRLFKGITSRLKN